MSKYNLSGKKVEKPVVSEQVAGTLANVAPPEVVDLVKENSATPEEVRAEETGPPAPSSVEDVPVVREEFWLVEKDCQVPRGGGQTGYYALAAGTVISSYGYDISLLKSLGVPLRSAGDRRNPSQRMAIVKN